MAYFAVTPAAEFVTKIQEKERFPSVVVTVSKDVTTGSAYRMNSEQGFFSFEGICLYGGLMAAAPYVRDAELKSPFTNRPC